MRRAWTRREHDQLHSAQDSVHNLNRAKQQCARPARHAVRVARPARARDAAASSRQPESEPGRRAAWKCLPAGPHTDAVHARGRAVLAESTQESDFHVAGHRQPLRALEIATAALHMGHALDSEKGEDHLHTQKGEAYHARRAD